MNSSETPRTRPKPGTARSRTIAALTTCLFCALPFHLALATTPQAADTQAAAPAIDPDAMEALNKMGAYLRTLKAFQVTAENTTDDVLDSGQTVETSTKIDMLAAKPNRLRVEITGDFKHRLFFYDGKNFTIWGEAVNYYATVPAPPTIPQLVDDIDQKYGIELPLVDLFKWGTDQDDIKAIKTAADIGPASVDGVTCEQYAFHQDGTDWQVWIQLGDFPLPRKLVIRTLTDDARPQYSSTMTWNLAPSFDNDSFTFVPSPDARRIAIAETDANSTEKAK